MSVKGKLFACAMACALALGLAACANPTASQGSGATQASSESPSSDSASSASSEAASSQSATFTMGAVNVGVYRNSSLGISWAAPEGWSFANDSELAELNRSVGNDANSSDVADALGNGTAYLDMLATSQDGLSNVSVSIEGVSAQDMASTSQDKALDTVAAGAKTSLQDQGAVNIKLDKGTTPLCGVQVPSAVLSYELLGYPVFQRVALLTRGSYLVTVTATCVNDDQTAGLIGIFQPL